MSYEYINNEFKDVLGFKPSAAASDEMLLSIQAGSAFRGIHIPNVDVPTVALELLKAAGHTDLAGYVASAIAAREAAEKAEAEAAEKKLQERRDALAKELFSLDLTFEELGPRSAVRTAIHRIIDLQDKLDGASRD